MVRLVFTVLFTRSAPIRETTPTSEGMDGDWPVNSAV